MFWAEELEEEEEEEEEARNAAEGDGGQQRGSNPAGGRDREGAHGGASLTLPEELWEVWARLSADPGRHLRILDGLTEVQRITCTSYSTITRALHQGQPVVVKVGGC